MDLPSIIELHFSNVCTGDCVVCSKAHGFDNWRFMTNDVFFATVNQLRGLNRRFIIQLGGDGDAFVHPDFLGHVGVLRRELPRSHLCLYTSGFSLTPHCSDVLVGLLDELQVRLDSLDPTVYRRSTGMELATTLENLRYFAHTNRRTRFCIIYLPLYLYAKACRTILGKEPTYWKRMKPAEALLCDEYPAIQTYFAKLECAVPVETRVTGLSLWAERTDCRPDKFPCPRLPENKPGDMARQLYVYPNGALGLCGYDDRQSEFIVGNVLYDRIEDVWGSPKMLAIMDRIRARTASRHPYCCVNAMACRMWEPWEIA